MYDTLVKLHATERRWDVTANAACIETVLKFLGDLLEDVDDIDDISDVKDHIYGQLERPELATAIGYLRRVVESFADSQPQFDEREDRGN